MKYIICSVAAMLLMCSQANASLVIDDFDQAFSISGTSTTGATALNDDVAGTRTISLSNVGFASSITGGGGGLTATVLNTFASPQVSIVYSFASALDLHSSGDFLASPLVLDLFETVNGSFDLTVSYTGAAGTTSTSLTIDSTGVRGIPGSIFGNGAVASAVDTVTLDFNATALQPDTFSDFARFGSTSASISAVPEPASIALLGLTLLGGLGIVIGRRRKKTLLEESLVEVDA